MSMYLFKSLFSCVGGGEWRGMRDSVESPGKLVRRPSTRDGGGEGR